MYGKGTSNRFIEYYFPGTSLNDLAHSDHHLVSTTTHFPTIQKLGSAPKATFFQYNAPIDSPLTRKQDIDAEFLYTSRKYENPPIWTKTAPATFFNKTVFASKPFSHPIQKTTFDLILLYEDKKTLLVHIRTHIEQASFSVGRFLGFEGGVKLSFEFGTTKRVPHRVADMYRLLIEHKYHRLSNDEAVAQIKTIVEAAMSHPRPARDQSTVEFYQGILSSLPPPSLIVDRLSRLR